MNYTLTPNNDSPHHWHPSSFQVNANLLVRDGIDVIGMNAIWVPKGNLTRQVNLSLFVLTKPNLTVYTQTYKHTIKQIFLMPGSCSLRLEIWKEPCYYYYEPLWSANL